MDNLGFAVVQSPDKATIWAISKQTRSTPSEPDELRNTEWQIYQSTENVLNPFLNEQVLALGVTGNRVTTLAAMSAKEGRWNPQKLDQPYSGDVSPVVAETFEVSFLNHRIYAYSAQSDRWDLTLRLFPRVIRRIPFRRKNRRVIFLPRTPALTRLRIEQAVNLLSEPRKS